MGNVITFLTFFGGGMLGFRRMNVNQEREETKQNKRDCSNTVCLCGECLRRNLLIVLVKIVRP